MGCPRRSTVSWRRLMRPGGERALIAQGRELRRDRRAQHPDRSRRLSRRLQRFRSAAGSGQRHRLAVAVSGSYVMNSFITFAAESGRTLRLARLRHFRRCPGIAGVIANTTVLVIASYWMPVLAAKLLAIAASFVVNFSLSHFVVFRTRERQPGPLERSDVATWLCIRRKPHRRAPDLRHPSRMLGDRRALSGGRAAQSLARRQAAAGALRSRRRAQGAEQGGAGAPSARPLALPRAAAGTPGRRHRQPRRGGHPAGCAAASSPRSSAPREILVKDEGPAADRLVQGARASAWRCRWRRRSASPTWRCRPTAMPARRSPPMRAAAASGPRSSVRTIRPEVNVSEIALQGASVYRVNGLIDDCGKLVAEGKAKVGWFDTSTLKEPYRIEGKKTMGLELAEQLGWQRSRRHPLSDRRRHRPDRHVEGVRRARGDRLHRRKRPRMVAVQACGLRPDGARVRGGRRARAALGGRAHHRRRHPRAAGGRRFSHPAGGARERRLRDRRVGRGDHRGARRGRARGRLPDVPGRRRRPMRRSSKALADGRIRRDERAVLFNCATGLKYPLPPVRRTLDRRKPIDFAAL